MGSALDANGMLSTRTVEVKPLSLNPRVSRVTDRLPMLITLRTLLFSLTVTLVGMTPRLGAGPADQASSSYRDLVDRASKGDLSIDFRALRFGCLRESNCDPRGDNKDLISMQRAMQSKEYKKAAKIAEALVDHGFVNIEAHVICSRLTTHSNFLIRPSSITTSRLR